MPKSLDLGSLIDTSSTDVIALIETWLNDGIGDSDNFEGESAYNVYRCDRKNRRAMMCSLL